MKKRGREIGWVKTKDTYIVETLNDSGVVIGSKTYARTIDICKDHNINQASMSKLINGKIKTQNPRGGPSKTRKWLKTHRVVII